MPGTRCTVAVCNNSYEKTKRSGMNITYHKFPKDEIIRNIWIEKCQRAGKWNPDSCHVCSIHFTEDDYKEDNPLTPVTRKRRLKSTAIPSLFLTKSPPLQLVCLNQRKIPKISKNEQIYLEINDSENTIKTINSHKEINQHVPTYEMCQTTQPNRIVHALEYECSSDLEILESYSLEDKLNIYQSSQYAEMEDHSTQTDSNYFQENFKQLLYQNASLKTELLRWKTKCKKLMNNISLLESKIQTLNSK